MITIVASTNRTNSVSAQLADFYSKKLSNRGVESQVIKLVDLPSDFTKTALYENSGKNQSFNLLRDKVQSSDKIIFIIPEYNGGFPGVLKSFIDGLKFPEGLKGKKAALTGISSGPMGGALAISSFTDILNYLGCHVLATKPRITSIEKNFDGEVIKNDLIESIVSTQIKEFIEF